MAHRRIDPLAALMLVLSCYISIHRMPNPTGSAEFKAFGQQFMADIILHNLCLRMRHRDLCIFRFGSVKMNTTYIIAMMASQIMANLLFVPHLLQSNYNDKKHQSSGLLAFYEGIHRWLVGSLHKGTLMRNLFLFDICNIYPYQPITRP